MQCKPVWLDKFLINRYYYYVVPPLATKWYCAATCVRRSTASRYDDDTIARFIAPCASIYSVAG